MSRTPAPVPLFRGSRARAPLRDMAARNALVEANLALVWVVARKLDRNPSFAQIGLEELVSEGYVVLIRAAELWDEKRVIKFSTYACAAIRSELYRLRDSGGVIRIPVGIAARERRGMKDRLNLRGYAADARAITHLGYLAPEVCPEEDGPDCELAEWRQRLRDLRGCLTPLESTVLDRLLSGETQQQISVASGRSRQSVSDVRKRAVRKLRAAARG